MIFQKNCLWTLTFSITSQNTSIRGVVKLKKSYKSETNSNWPDPTHLLPSIHFFGTMCKKQKQKSELRLDPPTHLQDFLGFLYVCSLDKTLA